MSRPPKFLDAASSTRALAARLKLNTSTKTMSATLSQLETYVKHTLSELVNQRQQCRLRQMAVLITAKHPKEDAITFATHYKLHDQEQNKMICMYVTKQYNDSGAIIVKDATEDGIQATKYNDTRPVKLKSIRSTQQR